MPVQCPVVEEQEAISGIWIFLARSEDGAVGNIEQDSRSSRLDGTGQQPLLPGVIRNDHMAGKPGREALYQTQEPETERLFRDPELAGIKFRKDIVNVKNDRSSPESRQKGRENQKVGHRMNMDDVVLLTKIVDGDLTEGPRQEKKNAPNVGE